MKNLRNVFISINNLIDNICNMIFGFNPVQLQKINMCYDPGMLIFKYTLKENHQSYGTKGTVLTEYEFEKIKYNDYCLFDESFEHIVNVRYNEYVSDQKKSIK